MKKKLLLADDSVTIQKVVQITFSHDDYDLTVVDNGEIAYEKARSQRPDLILADVFMPGKNGYELCAAVKNDPSLATVPVLLLTGTFEPFDEAKARAVGADRWVAKPFESQSLITCVEELLAHAAKAPVVTPPVFTPSTVPVEGIEVAHPDFPGDSSDDIWGSDFVTEESMGSQDLPVSDPFAATTQDDLWDVSGFEREDSVVSATAVDDLWGSFEEPAAAVEDLPPAAVASESDIWGDDAFSSGYSSAESLDSELFGGGGAETPFDDDVEILEEIDLLEPETETFAANDLSLAQDSPAVEALSGSPLAVPLPLPVVSASAQELRTHTAEASSSVPALSEVQLDLLAERVAGLVVSRLCGTLLEKIAWEVVPDLAETMIKEELRKIRETVAAG